MKAFKLAQREGISLEELLTLDSAFGLRGSSEVSSLIESRLVRELAKRAHTSTPTPAPPPTPLLLAKPVAEEPPTETLAVHQLARALSTFKDDVIGVLREVTGERAWTANSMVDSQLVSLVQVEFARKRAAQGTRSASANRPRAARSKEQLRSMRVQICKPPETPGEIALSRALEKLPTGVALIGVDVASWDKTIDVDAIVVLPDLLATIEVKDTIRVGTITPYVNGPWEVDGQDFQGHGVGPTHQAIQQARVLGSARKRPELASLKRIPATIGVYGNAYFTTRPLFEISADCFSYNVSDTIEALMACAAKQRAFVGVGHVQALFSWLDLSRSMCFTREELYVLGFAESAA